MNFAKIYLVTNKRELAQKFCSLYFVSVRG